MRKVLLIISILISSAAYAQSPAPEILSPADGDIIYGDSVSVEFKLNNEANRGMMDVQHLYLKQDHETCVYTEGFSGTHTFTNVAPGERTFFIRMEDSNFVPVGSTHEVKITLISNSSAPSPTITSPKASSTVKQSDVKVKYSLSEGELPSNFSHVAYKLDSGEEIANGSSGEFTISNVADGPRTLMLRLVDLNGGTIGSPAVAAFTVKTALSSKNAKKVRGLLAKYSKGKLNSKSSKKLAKLLKQMKKAGSANPDFPELNSSNVKKALSIFKKIKRGKLSAKLKKQIKKLFK